MPTLNRAVIMKQIDLNHFNSDSHPQFTLEKPLEQRYGKMVVQFPLDLK